MDGEQLRDEGIARVLRNTPPHWQARYDRLAANWFWSLPEGAIFSGEDFRLNALEHGLPEPHHPNSWGACAASYMRAVKQCGFAVELGAHKAVSPRSHAHQYRTYRKTA